MHFRHLPKVLWWRMSWLKISSFCKLIVLFLYISFFISILLNLGFMGVKVICSNSKFTPEVWQKRVRVVTLDG